MNDKAPLLEVRNLSKRFPVEGGFPGRSRGFVEAVRGATFSLEPGETLALVGESGSGKSTLGKMIQGLIEPTAGEIFFRGEPAAPLSRRERARRVQMIFQDPFASLNPKMTVGNMLAEALRQGQRSQASGNGSAAGLLESVGLSASVAGHYPHQFSGGQRQRVGIARALALSPELIIADEPVSALDLSVQAQILNLLMDLKERLNISYLLIAHDLSVVEHMADRVMVMQNGAIVEQADKASLFKNPRHPYTRTLLAAMPPLPG